MTYHSFLIIFITAWLPLAFFSTLRGGLPSSIQLVTSQKHYGPDGPWQAVSVWLGSQRTQADLYPGGAYGSPILNPSGSEVSDNKSIELVFNDDHLSWPLGALKYRGKQRYIMDQLGITRTGPETVQRLSILLVTNVSMISSDGSKYPVQLGGLSLGGLSANQSFTTSDDGSSPPVNASLLPGSLLQQNLVSTSSYGLHVGSAALGPPLSLWVGGYDGSRIVGPVSVQDLPVDGILS